MRAGIVALAALLAAALAACGAADEADWSGYIEGDFVQVAPAAAGTLVRLSVQAGQTVAAGAPLFEVDAQAEQAALRQAQAQAAAAEAQARDTTRGRRDDELAVTRAQREQARTQAALALRELARQQDLLAQGFVSAAALDNARSAAAAAQARVDELDAALRVGRLPARPDTREAASAQAQAASAAVAASRWQLEQTRRDAPVAGTVADTYFRVGEFVPAGQPVLALLPPGQVKARFFVPETEIAQLTPGQAVQLRCDGCDGPIAAHVSHIATEAEFTPPVIYSRSQRSRLVFRVEARPDRSEDAARLRPGLPVDVRPLPR
jgi:HlyD family secretion protein